ncbi:ferrous iron transport protein B [Helicobacter aurati]|uniref:Ferrous iron transport protein B n=1 Tax=Helicobacter aurati TaxID=137778 RepID=A0A3D8J7C9_9HELI|nr:ferrous iron transport protein B [Helicobacter aurati]RDU72751.1 ferrous iron transport protein B [Helicobacter aurati]
MKTFSIVLVGQPNVGKSSLINALSGAKMRVGNFSGVTIQKAEAKLTYKDYQINIIDLPGTFSLNGYTMEEKVCKEFLSNDTYDIILNVIDSTNLERNLILTLQLQEFQKQLKKPLFIALNMIDEAEADGLEINLQALSQRLGLGVCAVSSTREQNLNTLLESLIALYEEQENAPAHTSRNYLPHSVRWGVVDSTTNSQGALKPIAITNQIASYARELASSVQKLSELRARSTAKIDSVLLHKLWSIPIFLCAMFLVFQISFVVGSFFQGLIEDAVSVIVVWSKEQIPNAFIASLVGDGIINGVGTVVSFLPLIATLFLGLTLLEGSGYMSRVAFMLDGLFFRFGLHGRSFIPLVMGFGCSVPAYMATRTLQNRRDKLLTLFIIGFMSCSARLPIYLLFVGAFFAPQYAAIVMFSIYMGGVLIALLLAWVLKKLVFRGESEPFVMDMPRYRMPTLKVIWFSVWSRSYMFLKKAGTVILAGAILVWVLATFPQSEEIEQEYDEKIANIENLDKHLDTSESFLVDFQTDSQPMLTDKQSLQSEEAQNLIARLEKERQERQLEYSFAGRLGQAVYPFFAPLGFDWRLSVSLITGFAAKEMVVTTLGVLYALGDSVEKNEAESKALQEILRSHIALPGAVAFILFIMLYIPCVAASATFAYESGKKIYLLYLLLFTTLVAYVFAFIGHEITSWFIE